MKHLPASRRYDFQREMKLPLPQNSRVCFPGHETLQPGQQAYVCPCFLHCTCVTPGLAVMRHLFAGLWFLALSDDSSPFPHNNPRNLLQRRKEVHSNLSLNMELDMEVAGFKPRNLGLKPAF